MDLGLVNTTTIENLGQRLREIRRNQNKSLEEIARQVGVTKAHLSQVERGKVNPSINTLWSLADSLKTSINVLFNVREKKGTFIDRAEVEFYSQGVKCFSLCPSGEYGFECTCMEFEPRSNAGNKLSRHGGIERMSVIEGSLVFILGDKEYTLNKEQSIQFQASIPHGTKNITDKRTIAIFVIISEKEGPTGRS